MTPQEAKDYFVMRLKDKYKYANGYTTQRQAFEIAVDVLEKQIQKKPILKQDTGISINGEEIKEHKSTNWHCPVCDWFVGEQIIVSGKRLHNQSKKNFCDRCGTKIDWSDNQ